MHDPKLLVPIPLTDMACVVNAVVWGGSGSWVAITETTTIVLIVLGVFFMLPIFSIRNTIRQSLSR